MTPFEQNLKTLGLTEDEFNEMAGEDIRLTLSSCFITIANLSLAIEKMDIDQQKIDDLNLRLDLMGAAPMGEA